MIGSCKKKSVELHFDMNVATIYFTVDTTSALGNISLATTTFNSNLQQILNNNSVSYSNVESIKLTGAEFTIVSPSGQSFNALDNLYAKLSAPGLTETRIAYLDTVPKGVSVINLNADAADLKSYLNQTSTTFRVGGTTNAPIVVRDSVHAVLTFRVTATGQL